MPACPICASAQTVKNGRIHNGKQRFKCRDCGRQFVEYATKKVIDQVTRNLIDRLLLERIFLAGIARAVQVSEQWLQTYVNQKYACSASKRAGYTKKKGRRERFNAMSCGHLWITKRISNGSG
ncbi:IS1/IS1595 family N-terminal zinc-binding domain-containing protein [Microcoleus sp. F4-D5]|uniref:IS1/IS1595 family N-terminal zinc-binding domain-containing protein n=1 Tax=Microcoleus sp. F4-D5 TaxID=2818760 RepID=UPI004040AAA7